MKSLNKIIVIVTAVCLFGCVTQKKEYVMPFYNDAYNASRLQPIALSETDLAVRIWVNNGTSVERIISISKDSVFNTQSYLDEIGNLFSNPNAHSFAIRTKITPKSGFDGFFHKLDSLKVSEIESQKELPPIAMHSPFSFYVIEIKKKNSYHIFKFCTPYPEKSDTNTIYDRLEQLIRSEFSYQFYFDK